MLRLTFPVLLGVVCGVGLLPSEPSWGSANPSPSPGAADPSAASLAGAAGARLRIVVLRNGLPVSNWPVHLADAGVPTTWTGRDGAVTVGDVLPGEAHVSADVPWSNDPAARITRTIEVQPNAGYEATIDIETGRLAGTARVLSFPVPGARLTAYTDPSYRHPFAFTYADPQGRFALDLPPGDYPVLLAYQDGETPIWRGVLSIRKGETTLVPSAQVPNASLLFGVVRYQGPQIPDLYVTVLNNVGNPLIRTLTGPGSSYILPLPPGMHTVEISDLPIVTFVKLGSGTWGSFLARKNVLLPASSRRHVDFDLYGSTAEGQIMTNGRPVTGASVHVVRSNYQSWLTTVGETHTDAEGRYRLVLPAGDDVMLDVYSPAGQLIDSAAGSLVRKTGRHDFTWKSRAIKGTVRSRDGHPIGGYPLGLDPTSESQVATDASGRYRIEVDSTWASSLPVPLHGGAFLATEVGDVRLPRSGDLMEDLVVPAQPGRIEGQVRFTGPAGAPISGATIRLDSVGGTVQTDVDGHFAIEGVAPGKATLSLLPTATADVAAPDAGLPVLAAVTVDVRPGETSRADIEANAGRLTARVRLAGRDAVPQYLWIARPGSGFRFQARPDEAGTISALLPPGPYVVEYAPGAEIIVPGVAPQLASRLVDEIDVAAGRSSEILLNVDRLAPVWSIDLGPGMDIRGGAVLAGDAAIVASDDGILTAVAARGPAAGTVLWRYPLGAPVLARPLTLGSRLFAATSDGRLHAIDMDGGILRGEAPGYPIQVSEGPLPFPLSPVAGGATSAASEGGDGTAGGASSGNRAASTAAAPASGQPSATVADPAFGQPPLAMEDPASRWLALTTAGAAPEVVLVDGATGTIQRRIPLPGDPSSAALALNDGTIIAGLADGRTVALDGTGTILWERSERSSGGDVAFGEVSPASPGRILRGTDGGRIDAFAVTDGQPPRRWPSDPLFPKIFPGAFDGIRVAIVPTADGQMLLAAAGHLGLLSFIAYNGAVCPVWPWSVQDPFGLPTTIPYLFRDAPLDLVSSAGKERLYAPAFLVPELNARPDSLVGPEADPVGQADQLDYGVFLSIDMGRPGNGYAVFYGGPTDRFVGRPVATGDGPGDVVLAVTEGGRLYAFPAETP